MENKKGKLNKNNKGITLISLIVTITILLILTGLSIGVVLKRSTISKARKVVEKVNEQSIIDQNIENSIINLLDNQTGESIKSPTKDNIDTISNNKFVKLAKGMVPVAWDENGEEFTPTTNEEWYNYKSQAAEEEGASRWANAKTEDGSYWVWIPRFEYKITAPAEGAEAGTIDVRFIGTDKKAGSTGYTTTTETLKTVGGTTVEEAGITISSDGYIIHPAFTNAVEVGGWDSELLGFWVAKYEMSMEGNTVANAETKAEGWTRLVPTTTSSTTAISGNVGTTNTIVEYNKTATEAKTTSVTNGTATYNSIRAVSKPNVSSWRYINISNMYENSYNYDRSKESHLIKNSEWGAVAYLTHSQYGRNGEEIAVNTSSSYITGTGGIEASTTKNATGVYDLSGGAWERVAIFNNQYTGSYYSTTDTSYASCIGTNMGAKGKANGGSTKYITAYSNDSTINGNDFTVGKVSITGDGVKEVYVGSSTGWFIDDSRFVDLNSSFAVRGGNNGLEERAGSFCTAFTYGGAYNYDSFRVCLSP